MSGPQGSGGETGETGETGVGGGAAGTGGGVGGVELPELTLLGRTVGPGESTSLEFFPVDAPVRVTFRTQELQALCPAVAGIQPDLYTAEISYTAQTHAVESKSLKLWLVGFRDRRIFAEHLVVELHDHLAGYAPALSGVRVRLEQQVRGGIVTVVEHPV